jgi:hypothetical protein
MKEVLAQSARVPDLACVAASGEPDRQFWQAQFAALLASRFMHVPVKPGSELTQQLIIRDGAVSATTAIKAVLRQMVAPLRAGCNVCIDISRLVDNSAATVAEIASCCAENIPFECLGAQQLSFSIRADHPALGAAMELRQCSSLHYPRLVIRFGSDPDFYTRADWPALVAASHADCGIMPVPVMASRPLSGLHSIERGECVMPTSLFEVPAETAWLVLNIDACRMGAPRRLREQLATCLRFADNLIDNVEWHRSGHRLDAVLNRRVAIHITGIGDMLLQQQRDPENTDTFNELRRWLLFVRRCFVHESVRLARSRGPFPELGVNELVTTLTPHYGVRNARRLVAHRSMRHRHLLALSPLSILPTSAAVPRLDRWLKLIPAIACADTLCMSGGDPRSRLQPDSWARLLQMTGAMSSGVAIRTERFTLYS